MGGGGLIVFEKVSFTYAANPREKSLSDITLTIKKGECVLLTGPSGCGKSTLLRLLNGLIPDFYEGKNNSRRTCAVPLDCAVCEEFPLRKWQKSWDGDGFQKGMGSF